MPCTQDEEQDLYDIVIALEVAQEGVLAQD